MQAHTLNMELRIENEQKIFERKILRLLLIYINYM